jgi:glycosyltransferase involved in cell wall biosynthesis
MRVGLNPNRYVLADNRPARVTICLLVFIPKLIGYYAYRFDILKLCLQSIIRHTDAPFDLLVFDNGSCREVIDYLRSLRDNGTIQYLILSTMNVGISGALKIMFNSAPGEVIAYSQEDVLFYPGWLKAHLEILDTFPKVGMVSGLAIREQFRYGNQFLQKYLSDYPAISTQHGHFIPDDWERDFYLSIGRDADMEVNAAKKRHQEILLEYKGLKTYSTAVHFQYIARKEVILKAFESAWEPRLMVGPDVELDNRIDSMGYARLSTFQRYIRHLGNVITPEIKKSVAELGLTEELNTWQPPMKFITRLMQKRILVVFFRKLYNWFYFVINSRISN